MRERLFSSRSRQLRVIVLQAAACLGLSLTSVAVAQTPAVSETANPPAESSPPSNEPAQAHQHGASETSMGRGAPAPMNEMGQMQGGRAPPTARDPYAYAEGFERSTMPNAEAADALRLGAIFIDQLEAVSGNQGSGGAWDVQAWYGDAFDRAWIRSEGDVRDQRLEDASVEALWFHAFHPFWGTQLGARHDFGEGPDRTWAAFGVEGLAPYWYDVEATAYVGENGRTAARLKAASDLRFTQRIVLRPELEANLYGRSDIERDLGAGLATLSAGLRLRYEVRREFAPYVGVEWSRAFGQTETLRRAAGADNDELTFVAGISVWR